MEFMKFSFLAFLAFMACRSNSGSHHNTYFITDFGAVGDSITLCTRAFEAAIDRAHKIGGGTVVVPPGRFTSGTIELKSNVTLEVQAGGKIIGSSNLEHYPPKTWGHNKDRQPYHLIFAKGAENIAITGQGVIDGNGPAFWEAHSLDSLPFWIMAKGKKISPMVEIEGCRNVKIQDVTLKTGGGWTCHLYNSDIVHVNRVKILNNLYSPNGDGIDISGCSDVTVSDCIIKTCDDAICLKTFGDSRECKRITINNNVIECLCAALKIGNESFRNIEQVSFTNNVVYGSNRAFAIYAEGGGTVQDITVSNLVCDTRTPLLYNRPIHISLMERKGADGSTYGGEKYGQKEFYDVEGRKPQLRNVSISNVVARTDGRILITAEPGMMIENLTLRDIQLIYPLIEDPVPHVEEIKSWQFSPKNPEAKKARAALVAENVMNLVVENFLVKWPETDVVPAEWQFPKLIANGTQASFTRNYSKSKVADMSAIWARNIQGGYWYAPLAKASGGGLPDVDINYSNWKSK